MAVVRDGEAGEATNGNVQALSFDSVLNGHEADSAVLLDGKVAGEGYRQGTLAAWLGRSLASGWTPYVEVFHISTDLDGASDSSGVGGGFKYLVNPDLQLDASFDRGLTDESPDWMFGLGLSARF